MIRCTKPLPVSEVCQPYQATSGAHAATESRRVPAAIVPAAARQDLHAEPATHADVSRRGIGVCSSRRSLLLSQIGLVPLALLAEAAAHPRLAAAAAGWPFDGFRSAVNISAGDAAEPATAAATTDQQQQPEPASSADAAADDDSSDDEDDSRDDAVDSVDGEDDDSSSSSSSSSSSDEEQDLETPVSEQQQQQDEDPPGLSSSGDDASSSSSGGGSGSDPTSSSNDNNSSRASSEPSSSPASTSSSSSSTTTTPSSSSAGNNGSSGRNGTSTNSGTSIGSGSTNQPGKAAGSKGSISANLSVNSYLQILRDARRTSWPLIAQKISAGDWIELSQVLVQPPFDDVRQACFYIPWALLQSDDFTAAVAARKAYVEFIDHVHALATIALKAADGQPGADLQVQQSFLLLNASVDAYLAAIPPKYSRASA